MGTAPRETAILLVSCPDKRGIVAEMTAFIYQYNGNIFHSEQHSDPDSGTFFIRMEWDLEDFQIPRDKIGEAFSFIASKFSMDWKLEFSTRRTRLAIMVSKFDHCLFDLLLRHKAGEFNADIPVIISNHEDLRHVAEYFGIPFHVFTVTKENKQQQEAAEIALLQKLNIDLVVLARYMQILSPMMVQAFPSRIINIHHSFLPAFIGARPYHQAHSRGVKLIGATSHYVTEDLDRGPIIAQDVARITHRDSVQDLIQKGRDLEKLVLSQAVKRHLEHKTLVFENRTVVFS